MKKTRKSKKLQKFKKINTRKLFVILLLVTSFVGLIGISSAAFIVSCPQYKAQAHENPEAVVVHMKKTGYEPKDIEIEQGQTVEFENIDSVDLWPASNIHPTHEIYSEFDPKGVVKPGESWSFKFEEPGVWKYHDHMYPTVVGDITVKGVAGYVKTGKVDESKSIKESICGIFLGEAEESATESEHLNYNENIVEQDATIITDKEALYSHVKKYGTKSTMQALHSLELKGTNCHDAAHDAGRYTYELHGQEAFKTCSAECHSGCYHGATEAYFKEHGTNNITESLKLLCNDELNSFFSHQCIHGIGHGLMAWASYDLPKALDSCDLLESGRESCYSGVFMENIVGGLAEEEGHKTEYLSDDPQFPCNVVEDKYKNSCYFLQTSRMRTLYSDDFAKIGEACAAAPKDYQGSCFGSMGRDISSVYADADKEIAACENAPGGLLRTLCLQGAVQDSFWVPEGQDYALNFCKKLDDEYEKNGCYLEIFGRAPQVILDKDGLNKFCDKVEDSWKEKCEDAVRGS